MGLQCEWVIHHTVAAFKTVVTMKPITINQILWIFRYTINTYPIYSNKWMLRYLQNLLYFVFIRMFSYCWQNAPYQKSVNIQWGIPEKSGNRETQSYASYWDFYLFLLLWVLQKFQSISLMLILLHSKWPNSREFGHSECNKIKLSNDCVQKTWWPSTGRMWLSHILLRTAELIGMRDLRFRVSALYRAVNSKFFLKKRGKLAWGQGAT